MPKGTMIVFSGLDGAGKSTQIALLQATLRQRGYRCRYVWSRGGYTPMFELLKRVLRRAPGAALPPAGNTAQRAQAFGKPWLRRLWLVLALLDLLRIYGVQLRWWRRQGYAVICDRYLWDTLIDFRLNFPAERAEQWWLWKLLVWAAARPDAAFLLLIPVAESLRRSDIKGEPFRDSPEVLGQRLAQYQQLSQSGFWRVLDGSEPAQDLAAAIARDVLAAAGMGSHSRPMPSLGSQE